jgi:hypothetical protein
LARNTNIDSRFCTGAWISRGSCRKMVEALRHIRNEASRRPFGEQ